MLIPLSGYFVYSSNIGYSNVTPLPCLHIIDNTFVFGKQVIIKIRCTVNNDSSLQNMDCCMDGSLAIPQIQHRLELVGKLISPYVWGCYKLAKIVVTFQ